MPEVLSVTQIGLLSQWQQLPDPPDAGADQLLVGEESEGERTGADR